MMVKQVLDVDGMSCGGCERLINDELLELDGVRGARADSKAATVAVELDEQRVRLAQVVDLIHELGFTVRH